jgi:hypothetical protein
LLGAASAARFGGLGRLGKSVALGKHRASLLENHAIEVF